MKANGCVHGHRYPLEDCIECLRTRVKQLQMLVLDVFSYEPDHSSEDLDEIGHSMLLSEESRATIIQILREEQKVEERH